MMWHVFASSSYWLHDIAALVLAVALSLDLRCKLNIAVIVLENRASVFNKVRFQSKR